MKFSAKTAFFLAMFKSLIVGWIIGYFLKDYSVWTIVALALYIIIGLIYVKWLYKIFVK